MNIQGISRSFSLLVFCKDFLMNQNAMLQGFPHEPLCLAPYKGYNNDYKYKRSLLPSYIK